MCLLLLVNIGWLGNPSIFLLKLQLSILYVWNMVRKVFLPSVNVIDLKNNNSKDIQLGVVGVFVWYDNQKWLAARNDWQQEMIGNKESE